MRSSRDRGSAFLVDFGLAKLAAPGTDAQATAALSPIPLEISEELGSDDTALVADLTQNQVLGTPYYMSPEAWSLKSATEASDIYSLGLLGYELLAGKGPFRDILPVDLPRVVRSEDPAPLRSRAMEISPALAAIIDRCIRRDPAERYRSAAHLLDELSPLAARPRSRGATLQNPYRGLRPFESADETLFFGRARATRRALEELQRSSFLLVTGDSGVGKSSLCAAGIVAELTGEGGWRVVRIVPGERPMHALLEGLAAALKLPYELLRELSSGASGAVADARSGARER